MSKETQKENEALAVSTMFQACVERRGNRDESDKVPVPG